MRCLILYCLRQCSDTPICVYRYEHPFRISLEMLSRLSGDGSLWFAVLVGTGRSSGFCLSGDAAALLVPDAALASLGA